MKASLQCKIQWILQKNNNKKTPTLFQGACWEEIQPQSSPAQYCLSSETLWLACNGVALFMFYLF